MGKKIKSVMVAEEEKFVNGTIDQGFSQETGREIFKLIEHFAGYGFNRCLPGDVTIVDTSTGQRRTMSDLFETRSLPRLTSYDGWSRTTRSASQVWQNGVKPILKLTTRSGRTIRATGNHPFRTLAGWKNLADLVEGDFVAVTAQIDWEQSHEMTDHEARLLGYVLAEGNTCHPSSFYLYSGDEAVVEDMISVLQRFANTQATVDRSKSAVSIYAARVDRALASEAVVFVDELGLRQVGALEKHIPDAVFGLASNQMAAVIGAMWSGDGCCHVSSDGSRSIYYATSSRRLASDVGHLMTRFGIRTTIREKRFRYRGTYRIGYQVHVVTQEGHERFTRIVGQHLVGKRASDLRIVVESIPPYSNFRTTLDQVSARDVFPLVKSEARRAANESGLSIKEVCRRGGVSERLVQSLDPRKKGLRIDTVQLMAKAFDSEALREIGDADIWWDRVRSVARDGTEMTYDLEVPETHNFVADDFVVHNSHSAGYGLVAYQTAFLKAHHPAEYLAALLTATKTNKDRTAVYLNECRRMGIEVLVPDVNESESDFTVHDGRIRFGLSAVRNVGEGAVEKIVEAREGRPLESFMDFVNRVDTAVLNKRSIESLIKAGAFDGSGDTRKGLTLVHEQILDATLERRRNEEMGQYSLFAGDSESEEETNIEVPDLAWPQKTRLAFEKEMLGLYVSDHPLLSLGAALAAATSTSIAELGDLTDRSSLSVGGIVGSITRRWTKKGDPMLFFQLEDLEGSVECIAFPKTVHDYGPLIVEDAVLVVSGNLDHRGDDVKVVARELKELEIRDDSTVRLTIPAGRLTPETVDSLKAILQNHPGSASVYLHMTDDGDTKVLKLSDAHKVEPRSALFAELKELLGPKAIL
jgi:DNA polymerase-3 subunit alpha